MQSALVSIIVPIYNTEAYLPQCLDSLLSQSYSNIEIVLVDDGSTDKSPEICDTYAKQHTCIRVIHQCNSGAAAARKNGVAEAAGDYLLFVDADDWLEVDYVDSMLTPAMECDADVTVGAITTLIDNKATVCVQNLPCGTYGRDQLEQKIFPILLSASPYFTTSIFPSMCGKLFKKEIAQKNMNALDTKLTLGEDGAFTYAALLDCQCVCIITAAGYIYRRNAASATQVFNPKLLSEGKHLRAYYQKLAAEKNWNIGFQLEEYMAYICCVVVLKTLKSSNMNMAEKRKILCEYIDETFPKRFLQMQQSKAIPLKEWCKLFLVQHRAIVLLDLMTKLNGFINI